MQDIFQDNISSPVAPNGLVKSSKNFFKSTKDFWVFSTKAQKARLFGMFSLIILLPAFVSATLTSQLVRSNAARLKTLPVQLPVTPPITPEPTIRPTIAPTPKPIVCGGKGKYVIKCPTGMSCVISKGSDTGFCQLNTLPTPKPSPKSRFPSPTPHIVRPAY